MTDDRSRLDAVILAGGRARRMGGRDKPAMLVGGRSMLDRVIGACSGCAEVIVVGPERSTQRPVSFTSEQPPGGGPVAALAAALPLVHAEFVAVLAADLPFLTPQTLALLASRAGSTDGAMLVDDSGRDQLLAGVWRTASLRRVVAAAGPPEGLGLGKLLLSGLDVVRVAPAAVDSGVGPEPWRDCDTPEDVQRAEELA